MKEMEMGHKKENKVDKKIEASIQNNSPIVMHISTQTPVLMHRISERNAHVTPLHL